MQLIIADWHKTHNRCPRIGGLGHNTNPLAGGEPARTAERDRRGKKILNLRVAVVRDLPNLAFTWNGRWFAHDENGGLTSRLRHSRRRLTPKCHSDNQISAMVQLDAPQLRRMNLNRQDAGVLVVIS